MMRRWFLFLHLIFLSVFTIGCSDDDNIMKDGIYTAEMEDYSFGWKEFVTITVKNNKIVAVEYNAKNKSGFIKSWDNAYMRNMNSVSGTYPNKYTREYANQFLEKQTNTEIDMITGASTSGSNFKLLAGAVVQRAKEGNSTIIKVKGQNSEEE